MNKETGLICTGESVRAILDGRKTQTRRVIKNPQKLEGLMLKGEEANWCPYGKVGDKLWVRETFRYAIFMLGCGGTASGIEYKDGKIRLNKRAGKYAKQLSNKDKNRQHARWRSPIFMPKWACRIWLEITGIRVEKLKEISDKDIICEGFETREDFFGTIIKINRAKNPEEFLNKWVWIIEFRKII